MKKFAAFILVIALAFSMSMNAFAVTSTESTTTTSTTATTGAELIDKLWSDGDDENPTTYTEGYPDIEIALEIIDRYCTDASYADYNTDAENIPDVTVVKKAGSSKFVITGANAIEGVGHFFYVVTETADAVAGATYDDTHYIIEVLITYVEDESNPGSYTTDREIAYKVSYNVENTNVKVDTITNTYELGNLTIAKKVTGNLSSKDDEFSVDITFTSELPVKTDITMPDGSVVSASDFAYDTEDLIYSVTRTIKLSENDGELTIADIPAGIVVSVEEQSCAPYTLLGYNVDDGELEDAGFTTVVMTADGASVVINNEYKTNIATGVTLDSLPYILVLIAIGGGLAYFFLRKRQNSLDVD